MYSASSTRRHCVFTFSLAGGNALAVIFGSVGSGLVSVSFGESWRATLVYMAVMYAVVAVVACLAVPNMPHAHPAYIIASGAEDRYTLLGHGVERRSSMSDCMIVLKSIDWLGLLILLTGVGCLSAALASGPEGNWQSPWVVVPLVYSGFSVLGFCAWERHTDKPLAPRSVWESCSLILVRFPSYLSPFFGRCPSWTHC